MLNESLMKSKYEELYKEYSNRNIDDYENFVLSRTIEHFFNTERLCADELRDLAVSSVKGPDRGRSQEAAKKITPAAHTRRPERSKRRIKKRRLVSAIAFAAKLYRKIKRRLRSKK